jgi:AbrB family looped-hinge helix DNA binding protein
MRITSKGRVTIPVAIREQAGLHPNTEVEVVYERGTVRIVRAERPTKEGRGAAIVRRLKGSASVNMTTDEIMALMRGR